MKHDAMFVLKTDTNTTGIDVIHLIEEKLDKCLKAFGLVRVGTDKGKDIKIYYERAAYRPSGDT
jgi:hypothetical protein